MRPHKAAIGHTWNIPGLSIRYCYDCGFHHQFPMPDQQEVEARYFKHEPYSDEWLTKEIDEHTRGWWAAFYDYQLGKLLSHIDFTTITDSARILDVGCGAGWFVNHANKVPWVKATGIEPSKAAMKIANIFKPYSKTNVFASHWSTLRWDRPFDAIRYNLVFEHLYDPLTELRRARSYLNTGGQIQVMVPNEFNTLQRKVGGNWWIGHSHINYFTAETLSNALRATGFYIVDISATFPTELFRLAHLEKYGPKLHRMRLRLEKMWPGIFRIYSKLHSNYNIGREIIITARKI